MNLAALWEDVRSEIDDGPGVLLVGIMTMVLVTVNSWHDPLLFVAMLGCFAGSLVHPDLVRRSWWWLSIAGILGVRILMAWEGVDNHVVLTAYWALAVGLALLSHHPVEAMARSGRWLVGLVFLFATGWKIAVPEFRSGEFFQFTLLADDRFRALATWVAGLPGDVYEANLRAISSIGVLDEAPAALPLSSTDRLVTVAVVLTIGTIVVEAAVALVYLAPLAEDRRWWRAATLLAFCGFTYVIVPVGGFGLVLAVMTIADPSLSRAWRRRLAVLFVAICAYAPVWHLVAG